MGCYPCQCQDNRHTPEQDHEVTLGIRILTVPTSQVKEAKHTVHSASDDFLFLSPSIHQEVLSTWQVAGCQERKRKSDIATLSPAGVSSCSTVCLLQSRDFSYTYTDMTHNRIKHEPTVSTVGQEQQETHTKCARVQSLLHAFTQMNKE